MRRYSKALGMLLLSLALLVGACGGTPSDDGAAADLAATQAALEATQAALEAAQAEAAEEQPEVTPTVEAVDEITDAPSGAEPYFVEEFDGSLASWTYFLTSGDEDDMELYNESGKLVFDLQGENLWVYLTYDEFTYQDVRIDVEAENIGNNNNNVSLICRLSDRGWYEFNVANNGLYSILFFDELDDQYELLYNGGSTAIRTGRDTNQYTAICEGDELTLLINNVEARSITNTALSEGLVGVSVASFELLPVLVELEWVSISLP